MCIVRQLRLIIFLLLKGRTDKWVLDKVVVKRDFLESVKSCRYAWEIISAEEQHYWVEKKRITENFMDGQHADMDWMNAGERSMSGRRS